MKLSFNARLLILVALYVGRGGAFLHHMPTIAHCRQSAATAPSRTFLRMGVLDQQAHESDSAYMKRLMNVASDAASFEKAVMAGDSYVDETGATTAKQSNGYQRANNDSLQPNQKKKGTYQRAEEWDAQRQANGTMTWEEKVQWEGQRNGNRVNQNDILRHHLNTF